MRPRHWAIVESVVSGMTLRDAARKHGVSLATASAAMRGAGYRAHTERIVTWEKADA